MKHTFIDTNIFIYASGKDNPHKKASIEFLLRVAAGTIPALTDSEVLQEILYRYWKIKEHDTGLAIFEKIVAIVPLILPVTKSDVISAENLLLQKHPAFEPRDAIHAAVMLKRSIKAICSYDTHFDAIKELTRITP